MTEIKKYLIISDFDHTIVDGNSSDATLTLLKNQELVEYIKHSEDPWSVSMQKAFLEMKKEGITLEEIKEKIVSLRMNEKWPDLLEYVREQNDKLRMVILSGSTNLFVSWFLHKNNYTEIVDSYYSLPTELHEDLFIKVGNIDHDCKTCRKEQCKSQNLQDYLTKNPEYLSAKIFYFGDGYNDLCAAKSLCENDILFPRSDWYLHKYLVERPNEVKCKVIPWKSGEDIQKAIKDIIN